jgi:hypothetical protein
MENQEQLELAKVKLQFAKNIAKNNGDKWKAALETCGNDKKYAKALYDGYAWDREVLDHLDKILYDARNPVLDKLPTKEEIASKLWNIINNKHVDPKEQVNAAKVLGELLGYTNKTKQETNLNINTSKVMLVKDKGDTDSWEKGIKAQQAKITGA